MSKIDQIQPFPTLAGLHQAVVQSFCDYVRNTTTDDQIFRVSLSGGSTPKTIYEMLADCDLPWDRIHWFWGDERNVPQDDDDSNFRMVREALLDHVPIPKSNIHAVPVRVDSPEQAAAEYEETIRKYFPDDEMPMWDLALLGMGDDAHTASLFPGSKAIDENERWFVENWVEKFDAYRYTLTAPAINSAREKWFLVSGKAKRTALRHVLTSPKSVDEYPSQLIEPTRWFVTADAMDTLP